MRAHVIPGYYHDGRFATLGDVVAQGGPEDDRHPKLPVCPRLGGVKHLDELGPRPGQLVQPHKINGEQAHQARLHEVIHDVDHQVLAAQEHRGQRDEDRAGEPELDQLEHAADGRGEERAQHHVGDREAHHGREEKRRHDSKENGDRPHLSRRGA